MADRGSAILSRERRRRRDWPSITRRERGSGTCRTSTARDRDRYDGPTPSIDHNLYIRGNLVYESNYRSGLRVLDASEVAQGVLSEVGFFDIFPSTTQPAYNGAWSKYPFFASGIGGRQRHRAGTVRLQSARQHLKVADGLELTIAAQAPRRPSIGLVVRRDGRQPRPRASVGDAGLEMPPATARLLSARASQGQCSVEGSSVRPGKPGPGSQAFVTVTIRAAKEGDYVSTAVVSARVDDGRSAKPRR